MGSSVAGLPTRPSAELQINTPLERDALAAAYYPERWEVAINTRGKRGQRMRHTIRRQAENAQRMEQLRAIGASCETCSSRGKHPDFGMICDFHSDFYGYMKTTLASLCTEYSPLTPKSSEVPPSIPSEASTGNSATDEPILPKNPNQPGGEKL